MVSFFSRCIEFLVRGWESVFVSMHWNLCRPSGESVSA